LLGKDEFDIDLVCRLQIEKDSVSQKDLKGLVGDRLRLNPDFGRFVEERRRCWTLSLKRSFHLDVLPAIPDADLPGTGILLTDTELTRWQHSNPIGYADWFYERMRVLIAEGREALAKAAGVTIAEIPTWSVRTPLQRAVQLLKRHRDVRFASSAELRPVSIIITTLAGQAYQQQRELNEAVVGIAKRMPDLIERRDGRWWVANPAHPSENFADKWNEQPEKREAFLRWVDVLRGDLAAIGNSASASDARRLTESMLRTSGGGKSLLLEASIPPVDTTAHIQMPPWPQVLQYECSVQGGVHPGVRRGARLWHLGNKIVPKKTGLRFQAVTNVPPPYEVKWQVSNTGEEARRARQLRGGFDDGEGPMGTVRWERTLYNGTHLVEALVVKNGVLVARSGRISVRIAP
jgi:hypothetical protein